jgi:hypothetical protein
MMINLTSGMTSSIWLSLREDVPVGSTASFKFTFTNDVTGEQKVFYPTDLQPNNKWSRFEIAVGTPENLSLPKLKMSAGMWSYEVTAAQAILETGKVLVKENKTVWSTLDRPAKNTGALRR